MEARGIAPQQCPVVTRRRVQGAFARGAPASAPVLPPPVSPILAWTVTPATPTSLVDFAEWVRSLPIESFAPVGILLACGLVLLVAGQKLLKPVLVFAAVFTGAIVAVRLAQATNAASSPLLWAAGGAVVGFLAILLSYRLALGVAMGAIGAVAAVLIATAAAEMGLIDVGPAPAHQVEPAGGTALAASNSDTERILAAAQAYVQGTSGTREGSTVAGELDRVSPGLGPALTAWLERCQAFAVSGAAWAKSRWDALPTPMRTLLAASAAAGAFLGFVTGISSPVWAAAMVTSLFGSLLMVVCGLPLLSRYAPREMIPSSPLAWLAAWLGLAMIGALFQWGTRQRRRRAAKGPARSKSDDAECAQAA